MKRFLLIAMFLLTACQESATSAPDPTGSGEQLRDVGNQGAMLYQNILEKKASFDQILEVFKGHDKQALSNNITALKRYRSDKKVIAVLKSIWDEDVSSYPGFSWSLLKSPSIKVSIAFALYGLDSDNANAYMDYIRRQILEGDSEAKSTAAMSLGIIGSNADIPALQKLIAEGDITTAGSAASALGMLHSPESRAALEKMAQSASLDGQKKAVIQQVLNSPVWNQQK